MQEDISAELKAEGITDKDNTGEVEIMIKDRV